MLEWFKVQLVQFWIQTQLGTGRWAQADFLCVKNDNHDDTNRQSKAIYTPRTFILNDSRDSIGFWVSSRFSLTPRVYARIRV